MITLTQEQELIIAAGLGGTKNLLVRAKAGTGKTYTLKALAARLRPQPAIAVAFNKRIAADLTAALPPWFTVKTLNGLGHGALARAPALQGKKLVLVDRKIGKIVSEIFREAKYEGGEEDWTLVRDWVDAARRAGLVHESFLPRFKGLVPDAREAWFELSSEAKPNPELWGFAREALRRSTKAVLERGEIDFDDQIYASCLLGGQYPNFGLVLVDEAQDLSPLNHLQVKKTGAGRLIVVGDPLQSIYAFRGADARSFEKLFALRKADSWLELPLQTTFRCPRSVVERQQEHAPGYAAAEGAPEGQVLRWYPQEPGTPVQGKILRPEVDEYPIGHESWTYEWLKGLRQSPADRIAVLCRNNAPLLGLAFKLIRQGIGPEMLGRDIGAGLVRLGKSILKGKDGEGREALLAAIRSWEENEIAKAELMDRGHLIEGVRDRAECLKAVLEQDGISNALDLERALENLFSRSHGELVLATGHKAKGLEWEIVLHLDPWRIPSKFAQRDEQAMEQERNLLYVLETRTKRVLVEANLEDFA